MYAVRCPECGRPAPLSLASPDLFRCPACGHAGSPPPASVDQLRQAAAVLEGLDARHRQLTTMQRRMIGSGLGATLVYLGVLALTVAPFGCFFWLWVAATRGRPASLLEGFFVAAPLVLVALFGASGLGFLLPRLRRVRESLAAFPPSAPGEPAGCHVCGGPIPVRETGAFARCPYCRADNVVDPRVLAALGNRRGDVLDGFEQEVTQRARIGQQAFRSAVRGVVLAAGIAVPATFAATCVLNAVLADVETAPHEELEYAFVDAPGGRCVAVVEPHTTQDGWVRLTGYEWPGSETLTRERLRQGVPTVRVDGLVGLRVSSAVNTDHGPFTVERAVGVATGENRLVMRAADGFERLGWATEVCLVEGVDPPVATVPLTSASP